jgi:hypothetical protein
MFDKRLNARWAPGLESDVLEGCSWPVERLPSTGSVGLVAAAGLTASASTCNGMRLVRRFLPAVPSVALPMPRQDCTTVAATRLPGCGRPSRAIGGYMV